MTKYSMEVTSGEKKIYIKKRLERLSYLSMTGIVLTVEKT